MQHSQKYLSEVIKIADSIKTDDCERLVEELVQLRQRSGRLFVIGLGGSAANAGHAVNDFRKIAEIETYSPTDNVSELTARANDEGFDTIFSEYLRVSKINANDAILVLSVGGGSVEKNISVSIVKALDYAKKCGTHIYGIVGRNGGYTKQVSTVCIQIPESDSHMLTPLTESYQAIVWHLIVSHPRLQKVSNKWESTI